MGSVRSPASSLLRTSTDATPPGPNDLRRLREKYPNVKPLYTLQVAVWSTFGDKNAQRTDMRSAAEVLQGTAAEERRGVGSPR